MKKFKSQEEIAQWQAFQRGKTYIVQWMQLITLMLATAITFVAAIHTPSWLEWIAAGCAFLSLVVTTYLMGIPQKNSTDRLLQSMRNPK